MSGREVGRQKKVLSTNKKKRCWVTSGAFTFGEPIYHFSHPARRDRPRHDAVHGRRVQKRNGQLFSAMRLYIGNTSHKNKILLQIMYLH